MDINDIVQQAQGALKNVSDEQIKQGAEFLKDKAPDQIDGIVDTAAGFLESQNDK
ncbi:MAG: antitoxin [Protaetiibacter sp.]